MAFGGTITTTTNLNALYYDKKFLKVAEANTVWGQVTTERTMPQNAGDIVRMHVYAPKTNAQIAALSALTEGENPSSSTLTVNTVSAQIAEYGDHWDVSSKLSLVSIDPEVERHTDFAGKQAGRHVDTLIMTEMKNATNTTWANSKTTVSTVGASDTLSIALVRNAKRKLQNRFADPSDSGDFMCVIPVDSEYDVQGDSKWENIGLYVNGQGVKVLKGEIGRLYGVRFITTQNPSVESVSGGASNVKVYNSYLIGQEAIGHIKPTGKAGNPMIIVKTPGPNDTSNPLDMFGTFGYKFTTAVKILNNSFVEEIRHGATYTD